MKPVWEQDSKMLEILIIVEEELRRQNK